MLKLISGKIQFWKNTHHTRIIILEFCHINLENYVFFYSHPTILRILISNKCKNIDVHIYALTYIESEREKKKEKITRQGSNFIVS